MFIIWFYHLNRYYLYTLLGTVVLFVSLIVSGIDTVTIIKTISPIIQYFCSIFPAILVNKNIPKGINIKSPVISHGLYFLSIKNINVRIIPFSIVNPESLIVNHISFSP